MYRVLYSNAYDGTDDWGVFSRDELHKILNPRKPDYVELRYLTVISYELGRDLEDSEILEIKNKST